MSRLAAPAVVLIAVTLIVWLIGRADEDRQRAIDGPALGQAGEAERAGSALDGARPGVRSVAAATAAHAGSLAALTGVLVDPDGAPVAGARVTLLEVTSTGLARGDELALTETRSAADGRFEFRHATPHAQHLVHARRGDAPALLRIVETPLEAGGTADVGTYAFAPTTPLRGRLVDASGAPVAGARVRIGMVRRWHAGGMQRWEQVFALRRGEFAYASSDFGAAVVRPDQLVHALERFAPLAEAQSDSAGHFTFDAAPLAHENRTLLVDHPAQPPAAFSLKEDLADVGDQELHAARTLSGRVIDADDGSPVAGAQVVAGRFGWLVLLPMIAALVGEATTADDGSFTVHGLAARDPLVVAARRAPDEPWTWKRLKRDAEDVVLESRRLATVEVRVVDAEGRALAGARVSGSFTPRDLPRWANEAVPFHATADGDGRASVECLADTPLRVHCDGYLPKVLEPLAAGPHTVELERGSPLALRLVDAHSGAPIAGARLRAGTAHAFTDAQGDALFECVSAARPLPVSAEHPAYGVRALEAFGGEVALAPCGTVALEVNCVGGLPEPVTLELARAEAPEAWLDRRLATTDAEGNVLVPTLPPGAWRYRLLRRFLDQDVLVFAALHTYPAVLAEGELNVAPAQTTPLRIGLTQERFPDRLSGAASIAGHVSLDGVVPNHAELVLRHTAVQGFERVESLDEHGAFRFEDLPPGSYRVRLNFEGRRRLFPPQVELAPGEQRVVDWRWRSCAATVRVLDAHGAPVEGGIVNVDGLEPDIFGVGGGGYTDARGEVELTLLISGRCTLFARADELGHLRREEVFPPGSHRTLEVRLDPGVPLAGTIGFDEGLDPPQEEWPQNWGVQYSPMLVRFTSAVDPDAQGELRLHPDQPNAFEFVGFPPGEVTVTATGFTGEVAPIVIDLPGAGASDLRLHFAH